MTFPSPEDYTSTPWTDPNGIQWIAEILSDGSPRWSRYAAPAGAGSGDVTGPASATAGNLAVFADATGNVIEDGGAPLVIGTGATDAMAGNTTATDIGGVADDDTRLIDDRYPTTHASSHATTGSDAIAPSDIGAAAADHPHTDLSNATAAATASTLAKRDSSGGFAVVNLKAVSLEVNASIDSGIIYAANLSGPQAYQLPDASGSIALTANTSGAPDALVAGTISGYTETPVAIGTVVSSHTLDISSGTFQTATLTASTACTFTMPTATAGQSFILLLKQAATTGAGTATFTDVKWSGGTAPTITATAAKMDLISFASDGTNWYGSIIQNFTP